MTHLNITLINKLDALPVAYSGEYFSWNGMKMIWPINFQNINIEETLDYILLNRNSKHTKAVIKSTEILKTLSLSDARFANINSINFRPLSRNFNYRIEVIYLCYLYPMQNPNLDATGEFLPKQKKRIEKVLRPKHLSNFPDNRR